MSSNVDLHGRCAFITGASQGIGRLIAFECAKLGCNVILAGPHMNSLENVKKEIDDLKTGSKCLCVQCDVTKKEQVKAAFDKCMSEFDHVTILVNNAALGRVTPLDKCSEHELNDFHKVNVLGRLFTTQCAINCFKMFYNSCKDKNINCPPLWILNIGSAWSSPRHATLERAHMMIASNLTAGAQNELTWCTASYFTDKKYGLPSECTDIDARCVQVNPAVFASGIGLLMAKEMGMTVEDFAEQFSLSKTLGDPQLVATLCGEVFSGKRSWSNGEIYEVEGDGHVRNIGTDAYWAPQLGTKEQAQKAPEARVAPPVA
jgi:NAD(P)-dependent dehydrogenase (short-subunit alcohol dehydrogenase family)